MTPYFYLNIYDQIKQACDKNKPILFIGDGSGFLSNLILNTIQVERAVFIDLPQFLIRQFIVNQEFKNSCRFFIPNQVHEIPSDNYVVINQDSFPEIPITDLHKYTSDGLVTKGAQLFSYNQKPIDNLHTDWYKLLVDSGWSRSGYFKSKLRREFYKMFDL